jgi:hypothetical protein
LEVRGDVVQLAVRSAAGQERGKVAVILEVGSPAGLGALEVELVYDPEFLTAESVRKERLIRNGMLEYELRPGRVRCVMINGEPISTDGGLLTIQFDAHATSGCTTLALEKIQAWDFDQNFEMRCTATGYDLDLERLLASPEAATGGGRSWQLYAVPAGVIALVILMVWVYRQGQRRGST